MAGTDFIANEVCTRFNGDFTRHQTKAIIQQTVLLIQELTAKGEKVTIQGLGTFRQAERKARKARNPKTGEEVAVAAKKVLAFKPSKK
jgi:nucleoid DNA-binding protein